MVDRVLSVVARLRAAGRTADRESARGGQPGLDAMLLVRIAKQRALNETRQLPVKQDPTYFPRIKAFARLQLTDEELAKWL